MTALFIANCTRQHHNFHFRLPESGKQLVIPIRAGHQEQVGVNLTDVEVDAIVGQHKKYGVVHEDEAKRVRGFTGLCYSKDKPVTLKTLKNVFDHNQEVLEERGERQRKEAAVVASDAFKKQLDAAHAPVDVEAVEVEELEQTAEPGDLPSLAAGTRVDRNVDPEAGEVKGRGRGGRGGRNR